jgi:hypothetical protein
VAVKPASSTRIGSIHQWTATLALVFCRGYGVVVTARTLSLSLSLTTIRMEGENDSKKNPVPDTNRRANSDGPGLKGSEAVAFCRPSSMIEEGSALAARGSPRQPPPQKNRVAPGALTWPRAGKCFHGPRPHAMQWSIWASSDACDGPVEQQSVHVIDLHPRPRPRRHAARAMRSQKEPEGGGKRQPPPPPPLLLATRRIVAGEGERARLGGVDETGRSNQLATR